MSAPDPSNPPDPSKTLAIGTKVNFVKVRAIGPSIELKKMTGKIVDFSKPNGTRALIKYHGGNHIWKKVADIQPI